MVYNLESEGREAQTPENEHLYIGADWARYAEGEFINGACPMSDLDVRCTGPAMA